MKSDPTCATASKIKSEPSLFAGADCVERVIDSESIEGEERVVNSESAASLERVEVVDDAAPHERAVGANSAGGNERAKVTMLNERVENRESIDAPERTAWQESTDGNEYLQVWPAFFRSFGELAIHIRLAHRFWVGDVKNLRQLRKAHASMHELTSNPTKLHVHLPSVDGLKVVEFGELARQR